MTDLVLTERAQALLDEYYPFALRSADLTRAAAQAIAGELDLLDEAIQALESNISIFTAVEYLPMYEYLVGLPVGGSPGQTLDARRSAVAAYLQRAVLQGRGLEWVRLGTLLIGNSWTYSFGGVNNSVLTITMPYLVTSYRHGLLLRLLQSITPASIRIQINSNTGFLLDISTLDGDLLN